MFLGKLLSTDPAPLFSRLRANAHRQKPGLLAWHIRWSQLFVLAVFVLVTVWLQPELAL